MTVFWSDPTRSESWWSRPASQLEDEYYAKPANTSGLADPRKTMVRSGFGEIKPHNANGIGKAITRYAELAAKGQYLGQALIITYRPQGDPVTWGEAERARGLRTAKVDVYATPYVPGRTAAQYRDAAWWSVGETTMPLSVRVTPRNGSVFGAVAEAPVRKRFDVWLRAGTSFTVTNLGKPADERGHDVVWSELAQMYAELARATNDEFLAELAAELGAERHGSDRLDVVPAGDTSTVAGEVNRTRTAPTATTVAGPKRGDHVFALGIGKTIADMRAEAHAAAKGRDLATAPALRILLEGLRTAETSARSLPELVVHKGGGPVGGDVHSSSHGIQAKLALQSVTSLAHSLARMYTPGIERLSPAISTRHVAASSARAVIAVGAWLDTIIDHEAAAMLRTAADREAFTAGQLQLNRLRTHLIAVLAKVAGR